MPSLPCEEPATARFFAANCCVAGAQEGKGRHGGFLQISRFLTFFCHGLSRMERPAARSTLEKTHEPRQGKRMMDERSANPMRIWFRFLRMHQRGHSAMSGRLRNIGLSVAQFDLLSTLTEDEGITQRDLAERLYVTKGNVSGLVDRLVEAGLVDRKPIPGDRRSHALHLTSEGRRLAAEGMDVQKCFIHETIGRLPASDLELLDRTLSRWRDTFKDLEAKG